MLCQRYSNTYSVCKSISYFSLKKINLCKENSVQFQSQRNLKYARNFTGNQKYVGANALYWCHDTPLTRIHNSRSLQQKLIFCNLSSKPVNSVPEKNMVQVLNVAEKNDAAKNLAEIISRGGAHRREGHSVYNKIYEFETMINGQQCHMKMTSVSGHLLTHSFTGSYKQWLGCNPLDLFDAPVVKMCIENMQSIKKTLEREARSANWLIIWTDCDREGENIGYEIISVCTAVKPTLQVFRAKFSEITFQSVNRALQTLGPPDSKQNDAVEVRSELDLRIGASFTRFQTLRLQKVFPQALTDTLISYGSCQFPTLGFVVERYKAIQEFIMERFWKLKVSHVFEDCFVEFSWRRVRLFDELACQVLHEKCLENQLALIKSVKAKPKSKWRPQPLDTIELEKIASRKLRLNAKETMRVAEKLYTSGYISYPRTETNIFPDGLNLVPLIEMQTQDPNWGAFASGILEQGPTPRQGKKSDQAHPPIHPTKYAPSHALSENERKVYEFIVRHFLACCSKDARGTETVVDIEINGEEFSASGLIIIERNYLEVYIYDRWSDKEMPQYEQGQTFQPSAIDMISGETSPPSLLTEADLISLMEKHGIGTDATHADHIETIKARLYVGLQDSRFVPGELGMGLVEGYDAMGFEMSKPHLRAGLEADLKRICEGTKDPKVVLREQISTYREVFKEAIKQASKIDDALAQLLHEAPQPVPANVLPNISVKDLSIVKCRQCPCDIGLRTKKDGKGYFLSCQGFPNCKVSLWFPDAVISVEALDERCLTCAGSPRKLKFKFAPRAYAPLLPNEYTACIGGCDRGFLETLDLQPLLGRNNVNQDVQQNNLSARNSLHDSGYSSNNSVTPNNSRQTKLTFNSRINNTANIVPTSNSANQANHSRQSVIQSNHTQPIFGLATPHSRVQQGKNNQGTSAHNSAGGSWGQPLNSNKEEDGSTVLCGCNKNAVLLTVRKEGPNTGRQFYKCEKPVGQGCNFFLWVDEDVGARNDERSNAGSGASQSRINFGASNSGGWGGNNNSGSSGRKENKSKWGNDDYFDNLDGNNDGRSFSQSNNTQPIFGSSHNMSWNQMNSQVSSIQHPSAAANSTSSWRQPLNNSNEEDETPLCDCKKNAIILTVRKEGPNTGRQFYKCEKPVGQGCKFFLWMDDAGARNINERSNAGSGAEFGASQNRINFGASSAAGWGGNNTSGFSGRKEKNKSSWNNENEFDDPEGDNVTCNCGLLAKKLMTYKEGANKGREFFVCSKIRDEQCKFFQWADEVDNARSNNTSSLLGAVPSQGRGRGRGRGSTGERGSGVKRKMPGDVVKKRKCGVCGEEGHNRKNCPHN